MFIIKKKIPKSHFHRNNKPATDAWNPIFVLTFKFIAFASAVILSFSQSGGFGLFCVVWFLFCLNPPCIFQLENAPDQINPFRCIQLPRSQCFSNKNCNRPRLFFSSTWMYSNSNRRRSWRCSRGRALCRKYNQEYLISTYFDSLARTDFANFCFFFKFQRVNRARNFSALPSDELDFLSQLFSSRLSYTETHTQTNVITNFSAAGKHIQTQTTG